MGVFRYFPVNGRFKSDPDEAQKKPPSQTETDPAVRFISDETGSIFEQVMSRYEAMEEELRVNRKTMAELRNLNGDLAEENQRLRHELEEAKKKLAASTKSKAEAEFVDWAKKKFGATLGVYAKIRASQREP